MKRPGQAISATSKAITPERRKSQNYYRIPRPGILWNGMDGDPLPSDGGAKRPVPIGKKAGVPVKPKGKGHGKADQPELPLIAAKAAG